MKLQSLEVLPRGANGWGSGELMFGGQFTSLHAPNGSGKTPIVQTVVYGLGYPVTFRDDLASKCSAVRLRLVVNDAVLEIERVIDKEFFASVKYQDTSVDFGSEKDFSIYMFDVCGLVPPILTSKQAMPTQPYMATTLPIFYLDQDFGYSVPYASPSSFIKDQFAESVRFIFGFGPKNSFERKKDQLRLKEMQESLDRRIVAQQKTVLDLKADLGSIPDIEDLKRKVASLKQQLNEVEQSAVQKEDANSMLVDLHSEKVRAIQVVTREIEGLRDRIAGIERIKGEIDAEADTLSLNEEARRVFMTFSEICASDNCRLFEKSSQAYAKNLLYLKDQVKDLERNTDIAKQRISFLEGQHHSLKEEVRSLSDAIEKSRDQSRIAGMVEVIRRLTLELIESEKLLSRVVGLKQQVALYDGLVTERAKVQDRLDLASSGGELDLPFSRFKVALKEKVVRWLDVLKTPNVSRNVTIENDLSIRFGGESIDVIKGSTKIRIVLAIHAALYELYLEDITHPFRFLIFDTPKQHEIHTDDLLHYFEELRKVVAPRNGQVIVSSTDFRFPCTAADREWLPLYQGPEQAMYLGAVGSDAA